MNDEMFKESLIKHLSEQRHDFNNILQLIYGYIQLNKTEKALSCIQDYAIKMDGIGRLHNNGCIILGDLFYNKVKEAEALSIKPVFSIKALQSFKNATLEEVLARIIDEIITNCFYLLSIKHPQNSCIYLNTVEASSYYEITIKCSEKGKDEFIPILFVDKDYFWDKLSRNIPTLQQVIAICCGADIQLEILNENRMILLRVNK